MTNRNKTIEIAGRLIGEGCPCFIIAEAGVNHNGDLDLALRLVDAAKDAGADAVKFQTFNTDLLVTQSAPKAAYQVSRTGNTETQYEMLKRLELDHQAHNRLAMHCQARGIVFLSTPFDEQSADFLAELGVPAFKIGSGEITNLPFLSHVASHKKPLIVSTGMSSLGEVETAAQTIFQAGNHSLSLLHCVSNYPADAADVNLRAMQTISLAFGVPVGYSDHTAGIAVALAAVALGACILEKHFTLDRSLPGPDHQASIEPGEFASLVQGIRTVEAALGNGQKHPADSESNTSAVARRSLVAAIDIPVGSVLTREMIAIKRPGTGLPPAILPYLLGRAARRHIPANQQITLDDC